MAGKYGEIPTAVIKGKVPKFRAVHTTYVSRYFEKMMQKINKSFWARSKEGQSDELGNTWEPLKPQTHKYKPKSPIERGDYKLNDRKDVGLLNPSQRAKYQKAYDEAYKLAIRHSSASTARKKASEKAWSTVHMRPRVNRFSDGTRKTRINIRTGRLVASTRAGRVANNRYYAPPDQELIMGHSGFRVKTTVPYAKDVDKVREIIPANLGPWRAEAHNYAMKFAIQAYRNILNDLPQQFRNRRKSKTNRR